MKYFTMYQIKYLKDASSVKFALQTTFLDIPWDICANMMMISISFEKSNVS